MKITIDLDADLYRALKVEAARTDRSLRDVFAEALASWLERAEDEEDLASAEAALVEYRRDGGVAAAEFFERLAAETRASYGTDAAPDRS
jgi:plasmid stability protein